MELDVKSYSRFARGVVRFICFTPEFIGRMNIVGQCLSKLLQDRIFL